jgi:hypothetical protein
MPQRLGLWDLLRTYRQDYETPFHVVILSKHHHYDDDDDDDDVYLIITKWQWVTKSFSIRNQAERHKNKMKSIRKTYSVRKIYKYKMKDLYMMMMIMMMMMFNYTNYKRGC